MTMPWLYVTSVAAHVLAAIVWVGGMAFFALIVVPIMRQRGYSDAGTTLLRQAGTRFRVVSWTCLAVLVATGATNLAFRGVGIAEMTSTQFWRTSFGATLLAKLGFVMASIVTTAWHERGMFVGAEITPAMRRRASLLGRATMLLSVAAVLAAIILVRGTPW